MRAELEPIVLKAKQDRRRFRRVRVDVSGRLFIPGENKECPCKIIDLSPGSAAVESDFSPDPETVVILYADGFGRFEGKVIPREAGGFSVKFNCSPLKRERVAEQLTMFMNKELQGDSDLRRHDRTPTQGFTRFTRHDGELVKCEVLDLSLSGVSLKTETKPPLGEFILIGQMAGRVARHHEEGVGIEFVGGSLPEKTKSEQIRAKIVAHVEASSAAKASSAA